MPRVTFRVSIGYDGARCTWPYARRYERAPFFFNSLELCRCLPPDDKPATVFLLYCSTLFSKPAAEYHVLARGTLLRVSKIEQDTCGVTTGVVGHLKN